MAKFTNFNGYFFNVEFENISKDIIEHHKYIESCSDLNNIIEPLPNICEEGESISMLQDELFDAIQPINKEDKESSIEKEIIF